MVAATNTRQTRPVLGDLVVTKEILSGRFVFESRMNAGKLYKNIVIDTSPKGARVGASDFVDFVRHNLAQAGVCIPSMRHLEDWCYFRIGPDWQIKPEQVARQFGLKMPGSGEKYYIASASYIVENDKRYDLFLTITNHGAYIEKPLNYAGKCVIPVFFSRTFYESTITKALS